MASLRVVLGLIIAWDCFSRLNDLSAHYSDEGVYPNVVAIREAMQTHSFWSLHFLLCSKVVNEIALLGTLLAGLVLAVGWHSRIVCAVCLLLVSSLQNRIPNNTGGDSFLRILLFWSVFLPIGKHWSLDWYRAGRPAATSVCSVSTVALLLQVCSIYWLASIFKNHACWRSDYSAVELAFGIESFQLPFARWAIEHPLITQWMTRSTLFLQEVGPFCALAPPRYFWLRVAAVASFAVFHLLGIGLAMRLGYFPWVASAAWLPFLPSRFFNWVEDSLHRFRKDGSLVNLAGGISDKRTHGVGTIAGLLSQVAAGIFFVHSMWWNLASAYRNPFALAMPAWQREAGFYLGLNQNWRFFAPRPATRDGWYVAKATLKDGQQVDPIHAGSPVVWTKPPAGIRAEYANSRWHKYLIAMFYARRAPQIQGYIDYLGRMWNKANPENPVVSMELYFMLQDNFFPGDGLRRVRVFPFRSVTDTGEARFEGDLRQDAEDKASNVGKAES